MARLAIRVLGPFWLARKYTSLTISGEMYSSLIIFAASLNRVQLLLSPTASPVPRIRRNLVVSTEIYYWH